LTSVVQGHLAALQQYRSTRTLKTWDIHRHFPMMSTTGQKHLHKSPSRASSNGWNCHHRQGAKRHLHNAPELRPSKPPPALASSNSTLHAGRLAPLIGRKYGGSAHATLPIHRIHGAAELSPPGYSTARAASCGNTAASLWISTSLFQTCHEACFLRREMKMNYFGWLESQLQREHSHWPNKVYQYQIPPPPLSLPSSSKTAHSSHQCQSAPFPHAKHNPDQPQERRAACMEVTAPLIVVSSLGCCHCTF
jgi:hypothetical protein